MRHTAREFAVRVAGVFLADGWPQKEFHHVQDHRLAYDGSEAGQKALLDCQEIGQWSQSQLHWWR